MGRWGTPQDVANVAVHLAAPAASFITGQTISINGGLNHEQIEPTANLDEQNEWRITNHWPENAILFVTGRLAQHALENELRRTGAGSGHRL